MSFGDAAFFHIELSEEETQAMVSDLEMIDEQWMPKVEKQNFGYSQYGQYSGKKKEGEAASGDWWTGQGRNHEWWD